MLQVLQRILLEKQEQITNRVLQARNIDIPQTSQIKIFTGPRRCGKTCMMQLEARKLPVESVLYLDFEDERLVELQQYTNLDIILDSYHSLYPNLEPTLFFDEIQALTNWHLFIKRLHERYEQIYITGSNANLLSRDIATFLTGRSISLKARPFSFKEFMIAKNYAVSEVGMIHKPAELLSYFNEYRVWGGFPEVIFSISKAPILLGIFQLILYKDLAAKLNYSDYALRLIVGKLVENIGKPYAMNAFYNRIKQLYPFSRTTCNDYLNALELPYLTQTIYLWRKSFVVRQSERKTYFIDNGFIKLHSVQDDFGKLLENAVFLHLSRLYDEIFYYRTKNQQEVDFLVNEQNSQKLFQVSENISSAETFKREAEALLQAMTELNLDSATLITAFEEKTILHQGKTIMVIPVWKWMLAEQLD